MSGTKYDSGKPRMELLEPTALVEMAKVLTFGADKYGDWNWKEGIKHSRLYGAVQRHLTSHWSGETSDPESGLPHLAHAMCGLMMMVGMPDEDDRYNVEKTEDPDADETCDNCASNAICAGDEFSPDYVCGEYKRK